jgi:hypothetical protein
MIWRQGDLVAGHDFYPAGVCKCGRRWVDIRNVGPESLNEHGVAHSSYLSANEIEQIRRARDVEDKALADAMASVSGRGAPASAVPDEDWMLFHKRGIDE